MANKVEDRLIGMIDAKYKKLDKRIKWLASMGHSKEKISKMLGISIETVERGINKNE
jgi:transposase